MGSLQHPYLFIDAEIYLLFLNSWGLVTTTQHLFQIQLLLYVFR
ncbi:MAG: hypothetical protein ACI8ZN_002735 [Bacteroidia bacterium]|jgi:hypothetical protein